MKAQPLRVIMLSSAPAALATSIDHGVTAAISKPTTSQEK
jgi:hypothetical protein